MNRIISVIVLLVLLVVAMSCSGEPGLPLQPDLKENPGISLKGATSKPTNTLLWGLWDISWNPSENAFKAVPMRSAMFAVNVVKFMNESDANLIINIKSVQPGADYKDFDLDIGFKHPFPGLEKYTGFDVMGVFMGDGSAQYPGTEGFPIAGPTDQQLLNPDGYTRRFNAPEFSGAGQILPLQGYIPGSKGTPGYTPTAELNPYKYFADGLDANEDLFTFLIENESSRGCFKAGSANYRNFQVRMPNSNHDFQYAVLANWEPNKNHPNPPDNLDDFPTSANSQEAVAIKFVDTSDAYYYSETVYGGDIVLDITPWDWSASCSTVMEEYEIRLYSEAWIGPQDVNMTPTEAAEYHYTFHVEIPANELTNGGLISVWIEVNYPGYDYTSPIGVPNDATGQLTAYFKTEVNVPDHDWSGNYIYGFADGQFMDYYGAMNQQLWINMLNLPLDGPYAQNNKVLFYQARTNNNCQWDFSLFGDFILSLGYDWELVPFENPITHYLDTTGVKMLILATYMCAPSGEPFHPEEIQAIRDLLNGGGIFIILTEHGMCFTGPYSTMLFDQLVSEFHPGFSYPNDGVYSWPPIPYTDISPDPITAGVTQVYGSASGRFEVFGEGVSLVREYDPSYAMTFTAICKSPWKG